MSTVGSALRVEFRWRLYVILGITSTPSSLCASLKRNYKRHRLAYICFYFASLEQNVITEITNGKKLNPETPEPPITHLETHRKTAITPLDMNRFQSKAFHAVLSQHTGQVPESSAVSQPLQKEPSVHLDTPSKFLSKDKLFKPSFDVKVRFIKNGPGVNK